ncbi:hypothetical protein JX266_014042 [Neoarthrinium moseri]|nr:hypothetical protein JX266_014042 [Neoarthrinium moseri]
MRHGQRWHNFPAPVHIGPRQATILVVAEAPPTGVSLWEPRPSPNTAAVNPNEDNVFVVKRLLARRWKHKFFLEWADGTYSWEPRRNISETLVRDFEESYRGFDEGVDVLKLRHGKAGSIQWLLHWHGRPCTEDAWVDEGLLSTGLRERCGSYIFDHEWVN